MEITEDRLATLEREQDKMRARLDAYEYLLRALNLSERTLMVTALADFIVQQQGDALKFAYPEEVARRRKFELDAMLARLKA